MRYPSAQSVRVLALAHRVLVREHPDDSTQGPISLNDWIDAVWNEMLADELLAAGLAEGATDLVGELRPTAMARDRIALPFATHAAQADGVALDR